MMRQDSIFDALEDVPPSAAAIDQATRDTLALISTDPRHDGDRRRIIAAVLEVGMSHPDRRVDMNRVRARLAHPAGGSTVNPNVVGATIAALRARRVLVWTGEWSATTTSTTGNNGKPGRVYRLAQTPGGS